jgi:hypothetical protein
LKKTRIPGCGRRVICWDEEKMRHLAIQYGLTPDFSLSPENPSQPSQLSLSDVAPACEGSGEGFVEAAEPSLESETVGEGFGDDIEPSQGFEANSEGCDSCEGFWWNTEEKIGMSIKEALALWASEGKPVIHLGPGENCFDLEKLFSHRSINERHLAAVREWLEKRQR